MKIFLDTSVFVRFFTADNPVKYKECVELFSQVQQGKKRPYTSSIVLLECLFVFTRLYRFPKKKVLEALDQIMHMRNMTVVEKTQTKKALDIWKKHTVKFADCLIASQVPHNTTLVSYDEEFTHIPSVAAKQPEMVL